MKKRNILVFPCGSEVALDIYSSVRYSTYFHLIGASSIDDHGRFIYDDYISGVPYITEESFIPSIREIVENRQIDAIFPAMDSVICILKEHESELGCKVIAPCIETTEICLSKRKTYELLDEIIRTPKLYDSSIVPVFPCFAKPTVGYGARGTQVLYSQEEVDAFIRGKEDILVMEYLPGEEYTVDCFTDRKGRLLYCAARKRNRIKSGISVNTSFVENQSEFHILADKINQTIDFRGAWFFQIKKDKTGELCLLEIAARLGGSSILSNAMGVNLATLSLFDIFDYDVSISSNHYSVELDRALNDVYKVDIDYSSVYVDYDDCLVLDGKYVNSELVHFLYQSLNSGKKIYLLSKHSGDLSAELQIFRLDRLFDDVYHICDTEDKVSYINDTDSIFIDDSFAERLNVQKTLGIPVFSPDMVKVLM